MVRFVLGILLLIGFQPMCAAQSVNPFIPANNVKAAVKPPFSETPKTSAEPTVVVQVNGSKVLAPVSPFLYGNNVNPYMTQIVTEPVLMEYIRDLAPNVIRFPGGNLSSVFFWNAENNQPPPDAPSRLVDAAGVEKDAGYWYGKNHDSWTLSVDNYYAMLAETGNTGMITVNYGYARYGTAEDPVASAAHHAAEWVRYDNGRTRFWEIGNESNGNWQEGYRINLANNKDGQPEIISGNLYGKHFKVFADSMRKAAQETGHEIFIGAQLLAEAPASWWTGTDRNWNTGVFTETKDLPDFYIIHSYYTPYNTNSNAADILSSATSVTKEMMHFVSNAVSTAGLTQKPVALTEWNIFAVGSKQQISYVNGMHAAITLAELIKNKYGMAARWNLANNYDNGNDHGTFSQGNEPGIPRWNPRPSFYYMYYFQHYFGNTMIDATTAADDANVLAYASTFTSGEAGVVIVNKATAASVVRVDLLNHGVGTRYYYYTLTGGTDNGEFSLKVNINGSGPASTAGGPANYKTVPARSSPVDGGILFNAPARSVTYLLVDNGEDLVTAVEAAPAATIAVYPNPARNEIFANLRGKLDKYEVIDLQGNVIMRGRIAPSDDLLQIRHSLARGLYLLRLTGRDRVLTGRFIVE